MNLMPASCAQGAIRLAQPEPAVAFDARLAEPGFSGDVLVGARPEQLRLGPGEITFSGVAKVVEYHGADTILGLDIGQPAKLMARVPGLAQVQPGDAVELGIAAADLGIFSVASERRLDRSA
jgi:ABC-type sugar transport system ATPase subunit